MTLRSFTSISNHAMVLTGIVLLILNISNAQVRSSTNYKLESDSINFAGGLSTSTNYSLESTAGEVATGPSDSASYSLRAGYQQMREVFLSMTSPANVVMTPGIGGITGGAATGSAAVSVLTDSPSGYQLTIKAENSPAMQKGGDTIADYVPAGAVPDVDFTITSSEASFGFSPFGSDVVLRYKYKIIGDTCSAGVSTIEKCWDGLSTSDILIASGGANQPAGATTTLYFRTEVGGNIVVPAGDYYATTTLTALPL